MPFMHRHRSETPPFRSQGVGQPYASTSGRAVGRQSSVIRCSYGGVQRTPPRRPEDARGDSGASSGGAGGTPGGGSSAAAAAAPPLPASINAPRQLSLGYTGPRLTSRPSLAGISARQVLEARKRVVFDDADARMAAFDAMEVTVTCGGEEDAMQGGGAMQEGAWGGDQRRLASFNELAGPPHLLRRMKKARLNRPTPVQR
jgi:hypothetical protein